MPDAYWLKIGLKGELIGNIVDPQLKQLMHDYTFIY